MNIVVYGKYEISLGALIWDWLLEFLYGLILKLLTLIVKIALFADLPIFTPYLARSNTMLIPPLRYANMVIGPDLPKMARGTD